ncbi:hypothetical protein HGRIS_011185 [Hohenbuehelia grisea]|uniref:Uncharacterized protein n=1 Tax=Hohenbuehelia grisea TaxID=104357 RepID=A0ABR3JVR3_9AGAR
MKEKIRDNGEKIKQIEVLPYLVGNVVEILDVDPKSRKTVLTRTSTLYAKEIARLSRLLPDRQSSFRLSVSFHQSNSSLETLSVQTRTHTLFSILFLRNSI